MAELPTQVRFTQATSIALATTASGLNLGLSFFLIPRLLESPTAVMLRQWENTCEVTSKVLPPPALASALLNAYLAYKLPGKAKLYSTAALVIFSMVPYSALFLAPIRKKLRKKLEDVTSLGAMAEDVLDEQMGVREESGRALIDNYGIYNLYRGGAALVAGCLGLYASLW